VRMKTGINHIFRKFGSHKGKSGMDSEEYAKGKQRTRSIVTQIGRGPDVHIAEKNSISIWKGSPIRGQGWGGFARRQKAFTG